VYVVNNENLEIINAGVVKAAIAQNLPVSKSAYVSRPKADHTQVSNSSERFITQTAFENVDPIMTMLGRIGFGYLVLDEQMKVAKWNDAARIALDVEACEKDQTKAISTAFRQLVSTVASKFATGTVSWVVIPHKGGRPLILRDNVVIGNFGVSVVMLLSRDTASHPNPDRLQQMFGLTSAEVQLAISLASGHTPLEIARRNKVSRTTIRSHLAALFSKTETNRQSELVALLSHISVLP
jgi:DNA-binding CsgD family transcriptional regulator